MFRLYSPIFLLQLFCFYHVYTNSKDLKWYLLIVFLPLIGSLIYLYLHFYSQRNIDALADSVSNVFSNDPVIERLKKELEFSDTVTNRMNLASEYLDRDNSSLAIPLIESCLEGIHHDDPGILMKLLESHYLERNYEKVIELGKQLKGNKLFNKSESKIGYALSLEKIGELNLSFDIFEEMDVSYSNYLQRLCFIKSLRKNGNMEEATAKMDILMEEIIHMDRQDKRINAIHIGQIKKLYQKEFA